MATSSCVHNPPATFADDLAFLKSHVETIVLSDPNGGGKVALVPAWQGRVVTSTVEGDSGASLGWINRELVASGKLAPHINVFGGEDRFWLGPEGGQFSVFFAKGSAFDYDHWQTPAAFDSEPFELVQRGPERAVFRRDFHLSNWSGTPFDVGVTREIALIDPATVLRCPLPAGLHSIAFESRNTLLNRGSAAWSRGTGLLSIWILGMLNATPATTVVIPFDATVPGQPVNDIYFGKVPAERLVVKSGHAFFRADAACRSKIGIAPSRAHPILGAWDAQNSVLTLVRFTFDPKASGYVNSLWKLQDDPYSGDVVNSYNDGPNKPGEPQLGQFFELETSSPALALAPGESWTHTHSTVHLTGDRKTLDSIAQTVLGVSLADIEQAFR
ncbi:MAG: hypothetical protein IPJ19_04410 [Planctomycetes bacterium]|nr:hypothetical protein [Planctomycetota bacterium]